MLIAVMPHESLSKHSGWYFRLAPWSVQRVYGVSHLPWLARPGLFFAMNEKRIDVYVDAVLYIALKARSNDCDRTVSQHVRHLIKQDMLQALQDEECSGSGKDAGNERAD